MVRHTPSLNLLTSFDAASRHLSFKLAADELCVTPAAISHQIRTLEKELGVTLFKRLNRAIELTKEGREYHAKIKAPLNQLHQATLDIVKGPQDNTLRIHCIPFITNAIIVPNLHAFKAQQESLQIAIESETERATLKSDATEIAIRHKQGNEPDLIYEELAEISITPICSALYMEKHQQANSEKNLSHDIIRFTADTESWSAWTNQWQPTFTIKEDLQVNSYQAVLDMAKQHMGLAMGFLPIVSPLIEQGDFILPFPGQVSQTGQMYLVYHKDNKSNPTIQAFNHWFKNIVMGLSP